MCGTLGNPLNNVVSGKMPKCIGTKDANSSCTSPQPIVNGKNFINEHSILCLCITLFRKNTICAVSMHIKCTFFDAELGCNEVVTINVIELHNISSQSQFVVFKILGETNEIVMIQMLNAVPKLGMQHCIIIIEVYMSTLDQCQCMVPLRVPHNAP